MKKFEWGLFMALMTVGCAGPAVERANVVVFENNPKVTALAETVDHIELVPLETGRNFLLGLNPMLDLAGDGYVLTDIRTGRILYFGADGSFRAHIGTKGRGPGEYPMLLGSQVDADGNIVAFSYPDKVLYFKTDGELIREEHREDLGTQSCLVPEGLLTYFGYGSGRLNRVALTRPDGKQKGLLPANDQVINMSPDRSIFSFFDGTVYFTDTYNPTVYSYTDGEVQEEVVFDFGKSAIGDQFYQFEDPYASMDFLLSAANGFSLVRRYQRNERYRFVEEVFQKKESVVEYHYGIHSDGVWNWFSLGKTGESPFAGTMQVLSGHCLYFLLDPSSLSAKDHGLGGDLASLREMIVNPDVLEKVSADDNPLVAKVILK